MTLELLLTWQLYFADEVAFFYYVLICNFIWFVNLLIYITHSACTSVIDMSLILTLLLLWLLLLCCLRNVLSSVVLVVAVNNSVNRDVGCTCLNWLVFSLTTWMAWARRPSDANSQDINWTRSETIASAAKHI